MPAFQIIANTGSRFYLDRAIEHLDYVRMTEPTYWFSITDIILSVTVIAELHYVTCPPRVKTIELNLDESTEDTKIYFESENRTTIPEFIVGGSNVTIYWNNVELDYNSQCCTEYMNVVDD